MSRLVYSKAAQKRLDRAQAKMTKVLGSRWREPLEEPGMLARIMGIDGNGRSLNPNGRYVAKPYDPAVAAARALAILTAVAVMPKLPDPLCARCGHKHSVHGNSKARWKPERACHSLRGDGCHCPRFVPKKRKVRSRR